MSRKLQICFAADERLWRGVSDHDVKPGGRSIRPAALRLQISVQRERFGSKERARQGDRPNIFAISAGDGRGFEHQQIRAVVVDEPLPDDDGHALVAFVTHEEKWSDEDATTQINVARAALAKKWSPDP